MPTRIVSMMSRGVGKVKAAKARLSGLVGVFKTIAKQHGEILTMLEIAKISDHEFTKLWPKIRQEMLSHEKAEVREVFPVLRSYNATRSLAARHDIEAKELERLIARINRLRTLSPKRREIFQQLIDAFLSHAREEENVIFPKAQKVIGKPEAELLNRKFLAARQQIAKTI